MIPWSGGTSIVGRLAGGEAAKQSIKAATKQFTTLAASVIGAGGTVNAAELVFRGVSEAIKATGGDAEDVQSAI